MRPRPFLVALLLSLALASTAPGAQAQINGAHSFSSDFEFGSPQGASAVTVVSAAMEVTLEGADGDFGFFTTSGLRVDDLLRVCWQGGMTGCASGSQMRIVVRDDGNVGIRLPDAVDASYGADHVLAMWMDFAGTEDLNTYDLDKTLLAPSVGGRMRMGEIEPIPMQDLEPGETPDFGSLGGLVALNEETIFRIEGIGETFGSGCQPPSCSLSGKDVLLSFEGPASIPAFQAEFALLPFSDGSSAEFLPAKTQAAAKGLQFARINEMLGLIEGANAENAGSGEPQDIQNNEDLETILQETLSGALIQIPQQGGDLATQFRLNRFEHLTATASPDGVETQGTTVFRVADGEVTGAQPLYGVWMFQLPWWGFLLWGAAIGLFIARMVVKPEKRHERWDKYRWIGIVLALLMSLLVFILWDIEMAHVFGTSIFTTDASGSTYWATAGIQLATLFLVFGVVAAPLQIIIKNSLLLSKQGTFMGLGTGTGIILSYLLGATLLLSYLDLMLDVVL